MSSTGTLAFSIEDVIDGQKISPKTISLAMFNDFNEQVARFVRGSTREIDLNQTRVEIHYGSYSLHVVLSAVAWRRWSPILPAFTGQTRWERWTRSERRSSPNGRSWRGGIRSGFIK